MATKVRPDQIMISPIPAAMAYRKEFLYIRKNPSLQERRKFDPDMAHWIYAFLVKNFRQLSYILKQQENILTMKSMQQESRIAACTLSLVRIALIKSWRSSTRPTRGGSSRSPNRSSTCRRRTLEPCSQSSTRLDSFAK